MSHDRQPLGGKIISKPVMIFGPLIVICMLLIGERLVFGLGSVLTDGRLPVGAWIAFDLLIGTGFACGGWGRWRGRYTSLTVGNTIRWCVRRCWRVCLVTHWAACRSLSTWVATGTCRTSTSGSLQRDGTVQDGGLYDHLYRRDGTWSLLRHCLNVWGGRCRYSD